MTMQITYAARDSDFDGFDIHAGDYLGLCDGALAGTAREITTLLASLADKAAEAGKEFINIFYGADIQEPDAEAALELFRQHAPDAEVNLVSGGTDNHLILLDLRSLGVTGKDLEKRLDEVNITANKNAIPNDPEKPFVTSGLRLGTAAATTRGLDESDMDKIAEFVFLAATDFENSADAIRAGVAEICAKHPLYE